MSRVRLQCVVLLLLVGCAADPPPGKYADQGASGAAGTTSGAGMSAAAGTAAPPASGNGATMAQAGNGGAPATGGVSPMASGGGPPEAGTDGAPPNTGGRMPDPPASERDDIFGQSVPRDEAFWVGDGRIHRGDDEVRLIGLNWFGLETDTLALFGPVESRRGVHEFVAQARDLGFNALRVPLSPEAIRPGNPTADWAKRGDIDTGREQLDELIRAAVDAQVHLLLDMHTCAASVGYSAGAPDDPACGGYAESDWIADLEALATIAADNAPWVVGIDLFNEPHQLDWGRWRGLVERGGEAVLRRNPRILVFVEGTGSEGYTGADHPFWGENLTLALSDPIALPESRVVYAPHIYGPSVSQQDYFQEGGFPNNMPGIWDEHFGFLFAAGEALVIGEFGGWYQGDDRVWQDAFVDYLLDRDPSGFFYWSLNPNSGDTGGLLMDDWRTVDSAKLSLLQRLMP